VIGGVGTLFRPISRGAADAPLRRHHRSGGGAGWEIPGIKQVFYGLVLLLVIMFLPHGIWRRWQEDWGCTSDESAFHAWDFEIVPRLEAVSEISRSMSRKAGSSA